MKYMGMVTDRSWYKSDHSIVRDIAIIKDTRIYSDEVPMATKTDLHYRGLDKYMMRIQEGYSGAEGENLNG